MDGMRFGNDEFAIVVEGFEPLAPVGDSQIRLKLDGQGWRIGGEANESFGVVIPKLVKFGRNGAVRHWGSFADARTPTEVVDRVVSRVFSGAEPLGPWAWDSSSALHRYVLSSLFDANLGARCVLAVRGLRAETIIVQSDDGTVSAYDVSLKSFDRAIDALADWLEAVGASENDL